MEQWAQVMRIRIIAFLLTALSSADVVLCAASPPVDPAAANSYQAHVIAAEGQVSIQHDEQPWAISSGELVPIQRLITTGNDGFARFEVKGGSSFEVFANSRVVFRQNASTAGDLLDVMAGRVRIHLNPGT